MSLAGQKTLCLLHNALSSAKAADRESVAMEDADLISEPARPAAASVTMLARAFYLEI